MTYLEIAFHVVNVGLLAAIYATLQNRLKPYPAEAVTSSVREDVAQARENVGVLDALDEIRGQNHAILEGQALTNQALNVILQRMGLK
jgi:hypothetical protein